MLCSAIADMSGCASLICLYVGRYPPQLVSVLWPAPTLSPSFLLAQAIFKPNLFPYIYPNISQT